MLIRVRDYTNSPFPILYDGDKIYNVIDQAWYTCSHITLSFRNIEIAPTSFLNNAIGRLYSKYASANIKDKLKVVDADQDILANIKIVTDNAKVQFNM